ncbi:hypothetical protein [Microbacterium sp. G2-8]|uniref:hypothetical protein n=1 Tax=Microbacterium sp. G2-8 TaxID=2842454 RepID=UPI001C8AD3E4|nr:hypothetical protein [Microbacterium sp. G2-8]
MRDVRLVGRFVESSALFDLDVAQVASDIVVEIGPDGVADSRRGTLGERPVPSHPMTTV